MLDIGPYPSPTGCWLARLEPELIPTPLHLGGCYAG